MISQPQSTPNLYRYAAILGCGLAIGMTAFTFAIQSGEPTEPEKRAQQFTQDGNWKQAAEIYRKLSVDPSVDSEVASRALTGLVQCQLQLNEVQQLDPALSAALAARPDDRRLHKTAANLLSQTQHMGIVADEQFTRGYSQRNGGIYVTVVEQDRLQAVKWLTTAIEKAKEQGVEEASEEMSRLHLDLANALILERSDQHAWRLQSLTELSDTPNYLDVDAPRYSSTRFAPVTETGAPVLYSVPPSWEAADSDGQRLRWTLEQAQQNSSTKYAAIRRWADFLNSQFAVDTLQQELWFFRRPIDEDAQQRDQSIASLHTLDEEETVAKLANGINRFRLEDEFNPIRQYQLLARSDEKEHAEPALSILFNTFLNRRQYDKAAEVMEESIRRFGDNEHESKKSQLDNIIQPRIAFDPVDTKLAGKPAELSFIFRNAESVEFTAWMVDVEKILADTKQFYRDAGPQRNAGFGGDAKQHLPDLTSPGNLFSGNEIDRYIKGESVQWEQTLEPRERHWDRRIQIETPLAKAGLYVVEASADKESHRARCLVWIQDTTLIKKAGDQKQLYFVSDAATGDPVAGANIELFGWSYEQRPNGRPQMVFENLAARTDATGVAKIKLKENFQWIAVARTPAGRLALLGAEHLWQQTFQWQSYQQFKAYGISDRPMYRPGETIKTKFWLAQVTYGDLEPTRVFNAAASISLRNPQGVVIATRQVKTDRFGACEADFDLPASAALGRFQFEVSAPTSGWMEQSLAVRVEEYRKPEFEVKVLAPSKPVALGETIDARIQAKYYFGSPVTDAEVTVRVQRTTYSDDYYPMAKFDWCYGPGYWWFASDYPWYPNWQRWRGCIAPGPWWYPNFRNDPPELVLEQQVKLDAAGEASIKIDTAVAKLLYGSEDHKYSIAVEVRDASRRTISAEGSVIAAREAFKIYSWVDRGYYNSREKVVANFHARMLDGTPVEASGKLDLLRITYDANGVPTETSVASFPAETNADGQLTQELQAPAPGQYRLRLQLTDTAEHTVEGGYIFTVRGRDMNGKDYRFNGLELVPDQREYAPGETLKLQINANRDSAHVYLFIRPSDGVYRDPQIIRLEDKSAVVEIRVESNDQPNFFVEAFTVYDGEVHQATREIIVPPADRVLDVQLTANKVEYLPGEEAEVKMKVLGPDGKPVQGSCLIAAYDRSLDQIASDVLPRDIREFFWKWRRSHSPSTRSNLDIPTYPIPIDHVLPFTTLGIFGDSLADDADSGLRPNQSTLSKSMVSRSLRGEITRFGRGGAMGGLGGGYGGGEVMEMSAMAAAAPAMDYAMPMAKSGRGVQDAGAAQPPAGPQPTVRKDFADTAVWLARVVTDANGLATAKFKMPENLTGWKIGSWAVGPQSAVGSAALEVVTRRDLLVRLQTPRFLVQGDEVVLSAIVHNDFPIDKQVTVKLEIDGGTQLEFMPDVNEEQLVSVKSHEQKRIDWRCRAIAEGDVVLRASAVADVASDAVEQTLPILVRGFLKTDSYAGTVKQNAESSTIQLAVPEKRRVEQSQLVVRVSPTLAAAMIDALPFLADYPYGCTEQTLNRFLPTVITQRVLLDMKVDLNSLQEKRNNLNAQELGDAQGRREGWKRFERNPVYDLSTVEEMTSSGVNRLSNMQNADGGWGWFSGTGERSYAHTTATVVRGLLIAQQNEVAIVPDVLQRGIAWLEQYQNSELEKLNRAASKTSPYKAHVDNSDAIVFHVLVLADRHNNQMQDLLYAQREHLSVYGKSLLAWATHKLKNAEQTAMLRQNIEQFLVEDAENETAYLRDQTAWWYWYGSQIEATAMYLKLLAAQDPEGQTAPRLVKYLLNNRKHATYWDSTRDTALVVEAFADYLKATKEIQANVTAEVWLSGKRIGRVEFTPENLFTVNNTISLAGNAVPEGTHQLEIRRTGTGRLYWNAFLTNFTLEDEIAPAGLEVKIERRYYHLKPVAKELQLPGKNAGVIDAKRAGFDRTPLVDLDFIPSGELVEVELLIESKNDYEYLVIEDNKAACLEAVDTQSGYFSSGGLSIYRELRDKKVGLCIRWLPRGKYSVRYQLRSEAPGKFTALPAKIEGMYAPELVGNSADFDFQVQD
jgi:alpha-2-macroglobulin